MSIKEKMKALDLKWGAHPEVKRQKRSMDRHSLCRLLENINNAVMPPSNGFESFYEKIKVQLTSAIWSKMKTKRMVSCTAIDAKFDEELKEKSLDDIIYYCADWHMDEQHGIGAVIKNKTVDRSSRHKLKSVLLSCYVPDFEEDLLESLSSQIAEELDRMVVKTLFEVSEQSHTWDYETGSGDTIKEKFESLYCKLIKITEENHKNHCIRPNFIITTPVISAIFESCTAGNYPPKNYGNSLAIRYVQNLANRWKLYSDPLFPSNQIILGYRGEMYMDSAIFFDPKYLFEVTGKSATGEEWELSSDYRIDTTPECKKYYTRIDVKNFS